jgi:hypothetical protein
MWAEGIVTGTTVSVEEHGAAIEVAAAVIVAVDEVGGRADRGGKVAVMTKTTIAVVAVVMTTDASKIVATQEGEAVEAGMTTITATVAVEAGVQPEGIMTDMMVVGEEGADMAVLDLPVTIMDLPVLVLVLVLDMVYPHHSLPSLSV